MADLEQAEIDIDLLLGAGLLKEVEDFRKEYQCDDEWIYALIRAAFGRGYTVRHTDEGALAERNGFKIV